MMRSKGMYTAVGALTCALGIGFFMQSGGSADRHYGKSDIPASELPVLQSATAENSVLDVQEITLTSGEFETALVTPESNPEVTPVSVPQLVLDQPDVPEAVDTPEVTLAPECEIAAQATAVAAAMVDLSMQAPCFPNERITVHHNGMIFTETTNASGNLDLTLPALSKESVFIMAFPNGEGAVAQAVVEELDNFDRVVLQWKGNTGFQIHAREFGADYGSDGHIWDGKPGDLAAAVTGFSGMLTRHGDMNAAEPLLAEVYTYPKTASLKTGNIALSVETEVTEANCGLEVEAQSLEIQPDGQIKTQNLTLPVPACDATGSFLVLNNLLQDLKLAGS